MYTHNHSCDCKLQLLWVPFSQHGRLHVVPGYKNVQGAGARPDCGHFTKDTQSPYGASPAGRASARLGVGLKGPELFTRSQDPHSHLPAGGQTDAEYKLGVRLRSLTLNKFRQIHTMEPHGGFRSPLEQEVL